MKARRAGGKREGRRGKRKWDGEDVWRPGQIYSASEFRFLGRLTTRFHLTLNSPSQAFVLSALMTRNSSRKRSADDAEGSTVTAKKSKAASGKPHKRVAPPAPTNGGSASGSAHDSESAQPVPEASGSTGGAVSTEGDASGAVTQSGKKKGKQRASGEEESPNDSPAVTYRKLKPPRPFPTVPTSVSATGPRSAHLNGKNYICITRKTPLGMYLRRCKDVVLKDG